MAKSAKKNEKQHSLLDIWRQKTLNYDTQTFKTPTKCSQKQEETDDALKRIFGHESYKSDVQQKAVSTLLTGFRCQFSCF